MQRRSRFPRLCRLMNGSAAAHPYLMGLGFSMAAPGRRENRVVPSTAACASVLTQSSATPAGPRTRASATPAGQQRRHSPRGAGGAASTRSLLLAEGGIHTPGGLAPRPRDARPAPGSARRFTRDLVSSHSQAQVCATAGTSETNQ